MIENRDKSSPAFKEYPHVHSESSTPIKRRSATLTIWEIRVLSMFPSWSHWTLIKSNRTNRFLLTSIIPSIRLKRGFYRVLWTLLLKLVARAKRAIRMSITIIPMMFSSMTRSAVLRRKKSRALFKTIHVPRSVPSKICMPVPSTTEKLKKS